jgi:hypothetical protein
MSYKVTSFQEALKLDSAKKRHLLLGNGFSIACRSDIFRYDSLFDRADFSSLNQHIKDVFEVLGTKDFEVVMKQLIGAAKLLGIYDPVNKALIKELLKDAEELKGVLVNAIASSHPANPSEIMESEFAHAKNFLRYFKNIYSLNYDLLLYWTTMHFQETHQLPADDGFRTPDSGKAEYVSWDIEKTDGQNIFYLHGALHLFETISELQKFTWVNTGISLIEQVRAALDDNSYPLFVSEGSSGRKSIRLCIAIIFPEGSEVLQKLAGVFLFTVTP